MRSPSALFHNGHTLIQSCPLPEGKLARMTGVTDSSLSLSHSIQASQHRPVRQHRNQTAVMLQIHVCWSECGGISLFIFMLTPACMPPGPHRELSVSQKQRELLGVQYDLRKRLKLVKVSAVLSSQFVWLTTVLSFQPGLGYRFLQCGGVSCLHCGQSG